MTKEDLTKLLKQAFQVLLKDPQYAGTQKKLEEKQASIIEALVEKMTPKLEVIETHLKEETFKKALLVFCLAEMANQLVKNPNEQIDYIQLLENYELTPKENTKIDIALEKMMQAVLKLLAQYMKHANTNTEDTKKLNQLILKMIPLIGQYMRQELKEKFYANHKESMLAQNNNTINILAEFLSLLITNLYGHDTRVPGKIASIVTQLIGNLYGLLNFSPGGGELLSFMSDNNTPEPGKEDALGLENIEITNAISKASPSILDELTSGIEITHTHHIPTTPTLKRGGNGTVPPFAR